MAIRAKLYDAKNLGHKRDHILCRDLPPVAYEYEDMGNGRIKISDVKRSVPNKHHQIMQKLS